MNSTNRYVLKQIVNDAQGGFINYKFRHTNETLS